jgi:L-fucono-1,5-lactonase
MREEWSDGRPARGQWPDGAAVDGQRPPRIDAHHHLWDVESGAYDWPTPDEGPIYRTFTPADLEPLLVEGAIDGTVIVQTVNTLADTDSMLAVAAAAPWVRGVVGWVPLDDPVATLTALGERAGPALLGVRHLIHHEPDPDWLLRPAVMAGLREVARRGLAFDVVAVFPDHLRHVPTLADALPDLTLVIDHLAKPPYRRAGWEVWREQVVAAARRPNVAAKISGLTTAAGPGWTREELWPALEVALEAFGADRLVFGSDWPVCLLASSYAAHLEALEGLIGGLTMDERAAIMGGTAARVYKPADRR